MIGSFLGLARNWKPSTIGAVLGFGAGALISSVAFELAEEGIEVGGLVAVAVGLGVGALVYFIADKAVTRMGGRSAGGSAGLPLALAALLDGIPEQAVLGIGLAGGEGVSVALLVAVFVSNLPEAIGSSSDMAAAGRPRRCRNLVVGGGGRVVRAGHAGRLRARGCCGASPPGGHQRLRRRSTTSSCWSTR